MESEDTQEQEEHRERLVERAALTAWIIWAGALVVAFLLVFTMLVVVTLVGIAPDQELAKIWLLISLGLILVGAPVALFIRRRLFHAYWEGGVVSPQTYVKGNAVLWGTLELAVMVSVVGAIVSSRIWPPIVATMVAIILLSLVWPNGRPMTHAVGAEDDSEVFENVH